MSRKPLSLWRAFLRAPDVIKLAAMVLALVLLGLCMPASAAERYARQGADEVRLFDSPCMYGSVLGLLAPADRSEYRKATAKVGGQGYFACWREVSGMVHIVYEDGDQGLLPAQNFKMKPEA